MADQSLATLSICGYRAPQDIPPHTSLLQVVVPLPDEEARAAILAVHLRRVPLASQHDRDLACEAVAKITAGACQACLVAGPAEQRCSCASRYDTGHAAPALGGSCMGVTADCCGSRCCRRLPTGHPGHRLQWCGSVQRGERGGVPGGALCHRGSGPARAGGGGAAHAVRPSWLRLLHFLLIHFAIFCHTGAG